VHISSRELVKMQISRSHLGGILLLGVVVETRIHVLIKYLDDSNAGSLALRNSATEAEVHIYLQAS
jgi:hypothetical protein